MSEYNKAFSEYNKAHKVMRNNDTKAAREAYAKASAKCTEIAQRAFKQV